MALGNNVKTAFLKGLEALGKTASNLSEAAQQKLSEMNLDTRRREVLAEIPKCVMQLWKEGVEMPEPLTALLNELTELEEKLAAMRPQPEQPAKDETQPEAEASAEEEPAEEETAEDVPAEECNCECTNEACCCENAETVAEPEENE